LGSITVTLNPTGIEYVDYTWNPITGCLLGCDFCYARKTALGRQKRLYPNGFIPEFHPDRLTDPFKEKTPSTIFCVSMGDFFGSDVNQIWQYRVLETIYKTPWHTYIILTKRPDLILDGFAYVLPNNVFLGVSITRNEDTWRWTALRMKRRHNIFISFEPLLGWISGSMDYEEASGFIIGAQTKPTVQPKARWVQMLVEKAHVYDIPVFCKDNLDTIEFDLTRPGRRGRTRHYQTNTGELKSLSWKLRVDRPVPRQGSGKYPRYVD
jgi:protein gp37